VSVWELKSDKKDGTILKLGSPSHVLYGHHNEITALYIEETLGLIASCDKVAKFEGVFNYYNRIE